MDEKLFTWPVLDKSADKKDECDAEENDEAVEEYDTGHGQAEDVYGDWCVTRAGFRRVQNLEGKCFSRTGKGHMVLDPGGMEAGDSIFVLPGCSVPVVLRKESDHAIILVMMEF